MKQCDHDGYDRIVSGHGVVHWCRKCGAIRQREWEAGLAKMSEWALPLHSWLFSRAYREGWDAALHHMTDYLDDLEGARDR